MRVAIVSRIYQPEPSAAAFRLEALANAFGTAGHHTTVLTVRPKSGTQISDHQRNHQVKRFPVLRDRRGYVRGYLQYLSFDIPLFFRILFGPTRDVLVVEPPPTTLFFATLAASLRRIKIVAYAPDIWSDASESAGAPAFIVKAVRWMERFAWHRAQTVLSVSEGVSNRVRNIAPRARVDTVGNGIDTDVFSPRQLTEPISEPYAIYTGTASEWQGAEVFIRAIAKLHEEGSPLKLIFLGNGTAFPILKTLARDLEAPVEFHDTVPAEKAAAWLCGAVMSVASIRPDAGYDFAYPTKVFAAWATGTPVVFAGPVGPVRETLEQHPYLGVGVSHKPDQVVEAMKQLLNSSSSATEPQKISQWAKDNVSLSSVAEHVVGLITRGTQR